jgi:hypothetical protein
MTAYCQYELFAGVLPMTPKIHLLSAITATLCIATFFVSSIVVELFGTHSSIALVKSLIVMPGLFLLVPAIATAGITGFILAKKRQGRLVEGKKKRMPFIGLNGVLILVPAAIFLDRWATAGAFDTTFYVVQGMELLAGFVNLSLMGMNIRDGLRMSGRFSKS